MPTPFRRLRVASVAFFNSKPLIEGLADDPAIELSLAVPSKLLGELASNRADVALLPVIDYPSLDGLRIVPAGGICCDGPTLTVRLFARVPATQIRTVACDPDSHTSVALAKVLFARLYKTAPAYVDLRDATDARDEARLLIGDKVICEEPPGFDVQVDLGEAWKQLTGLPFVFAVWCARRGVELGDLPRALERAKRAGLADVDSLVRDYAVPRGWPAQVARRYLTEYLTYDIGPRQLAAIGLFHRYADELGLLPHGYRPLDVVPMPAPHQQDESNHRGHRERPVAILPRSDSIHR